MSDNYKYAEVRHIIDKAVAEVEDKNLAGDKWNHMITHAYSGLKNFFQAGTWDDEDVKEQIHKVVDEGTRKITELQRQLHNSDEENTKLKKECKRLFDMNRNYKADDDRNRSALAMKEVEKGQFEERLRLAQDMIREEQKKVEDGNKLLNAYMYELTEATRPYVDFGNPDWVEYSALVGVVLAAFLLGATI